MDQEERDRRKAEFLETMEQERARTEMLSEFEYKQVVVQDEVWVEAQNYCNLGWRTVSTFLAKPIVRGYRAKAEVLHLLLERPRPQNPFNRRRNQAEFEMWLAWETNYHPGVNPFDVNTERNRWHAWEDRKRLDEERG